MKFINGLKSLSNHQQACVATIGNFDGLHLGHQAIIDHLDNKAQEFGLPLTVISFEPLPSEYFMIDPPKRIYPLRDKIRRMQKLNIANFLCLKFNSELASSPPKDFVQNILVENSM